MYETGRDSMNLHQLYLTENDCYKRGKYITPKGIMVHSTGAENPNLKRYVGPDDGLLGVNQNNNDWNRSGVGACVHAFIGLLADGTIATYQTLPWNMRGWHCGDDANSTHISFEICEDDLTDPEYFAAVREEYKRRRDTVMQKLQAIPGVVCECPKGAFYVMAALPVDDADAFQRWLLEEFQDNGDTVMFAPGEPFYATPGRGRSEIRIAYVLKQEDLERAMDLLALGIRAYNAR